MMTNHYRCSRIMITAALANITKMQGAFRNLLVWIMALLQSRGCEKEKKRRKKRQILWKLCSELPQVSCMQNTTEEKTTWIQSQSSYTSLLGFCVFCVFHLFSSCYIWYGPWYCGLLHFIAWKQWEKRDPCWVWMKLVKFEPLWNGKSSLIYIWGGRGRL